MTRSCDCQQWHWDADKVNKTISTFLFCPWCSSRLIAPCAICEEPSNIHTGKTLYYIEDKNFCSPVCATKFDTKFRKLDYEKKER